MVKFLNLNKFKKKTKKKLTDEKHQDKIFFLNY